MRAERRELVLVKMTLSLVSASEVGGDVVLSTHTPMLLEEAIKRRKTPRIPEQNLVHRVRR